MNGPTTPIPPTLSICIPTLNRCALLCAALRSIYAAGWDRRRVEVCISDNASEEDYGALHALLAEAPPGLSVRYLKQPRRLPIDASMYAVRNMASGDYLYFLGDDDHFLDGEASRLLTLIDQEAPDLAIFNGILIDAEDRVVGNHFQLPPRTYNDVFQAFDDLRDKGMFGAVLVRSAHLQAAHFEALFGTAHGYGCYWFSLLDERHLGGRAPKIMIPGFALVALRMAAKSYNLLDVYYRQIPYEIAVYRRHLPAGRAQRANLRFERAFHRKIASLRFLLPMRAAGMSILDIEALYPAFHDRHALKLRWADWLVRSGAFARLKTIYRLLRGRSTRPS
ncbi:Glycosyltransferase involved in cell wall bisynthesis [Mitsuaria sp. PDC51]|jgi:glycosyltransferase involved in cell wall biosynthesis|uniref:glycosyltransferase n=1 Tax=unclassified Roseateles TaxID=2626991 RepID=UPI0008F10038|nr:MULTISPECIES: glycosyltransferase [unclassified Roseateles]MBB3282880.1 glycosyltransferase involved in cell wall biosynthesis [Mitsuaria sp. BK037]SFR88704.1 Glycosyltransferase involved in cell wall bisynthesis [Mitsuaria sp. PDC51]